MMRILQWCCDQWEEELPRQRRARRRRRTVVDVEDYVSDGEEEAHAQEEAAHAHRQAAQAHADAAHAHEEAIRAQEEAARAQEIAAHTLEQMFGSHQSSTRFTYQEKEPKGDREPKGNASSSRPTNARISIVNSNFFHSDGDLYTVHTVNTGTTRHQNMHWWTG